MSLIPTAPTPTRKTRAFKKAPNAPEYPSNWFSEIQPAVLKRDRWTCQIRGENCTKKATQVDHRLSLARGGTNDYENLQAVCVPCHQEKTAKEVEAARRVLAPRPAAVSPGLLHPEDKPQVAVLKAATNVSDDVAWDPSWVASFGPVDQKGIDGQFILPKYSLGYEIIAWMMTWLELNDEPFKPSGEQMRFILWAYAIDKDGEWIFDRILKIAPKGWGKDPLMAAIAVVELVGPARFGGWRVDRKTGERKPKGVDVKKAMVQIGALNIKQTEITWRYLREMIPQRTKDRFGISVQGMFIYAYNGTRQIERMTASAGSKEGERVTCFLGNELEHWTERNGMIARYEIIAGNLDKIPGARSYFISNAADPNGDSFCHRLLTEAQEVAEGIRVDTGLMVDYRYATKMAPFKTMTQRMNIMNAVYGTNAIYADLKKSAKRFDRADVPISKTLLQFYNSPQISAFSWFDIRDWNAGRTPFDTDNNLPPLGKTTQIVLAGDGSLNDDCTALVAMTIDKYDPSKDGIIFPLGIWKPTKEAPMTTHLTEVDALVDWAMEEFRVLGFWFDPSRKTDENDKLIWQPMIEKWHRKWGRKISKTYWASTDSSIKFDMGSPSVNRSFVEALGTFEVLVSLQKIKHNGDLTLATHIQNCTRVKKKGYDEVTIGKPTPHSPDKVDGAVTAIIAFKLYLSVTGKSYSQGVFT